MITFMNIITMLYVLLIKLCSKIIHVPIIHICFVSRMFVKKILKQHMVTFDHNVAYPNMTKCWNETHAYTSIKNAPKMHIYFVSRMFVTRIHKQHMTTSGYKVTYPIMNKYEYTSIYKCSKNTHLFCE